MVIAFLPFGWLRSPWIYGLLAFILYAAGTILVGAASFASAMASGHGSLDTSGWDAMNGMLPLLVWLVVGAIPVLLGLSFRVGKAARPTSPDVHKIVPTQPKTLRQCTEERREAEQAMPPNGP